MASSLVDNLIALTPCGFAVTFFCDFGASNKCPDDVYLLTYLLIVNLYVW